MDGNSTLRRGRGTLFGRPGEDLDLGGPALAEIPEALGQPPKLEHHAQLRVRETVEV